MRYRPQIRVRLGFGLCRKTCKQGQTEFPICCRTFGKPLALDFVMSKGPQPNADVGPPRQSLQSNAEPPPEAPLFWFHLAGYHLPLSTRDCFQKLFLFS